MKPEPPGSDLPPAQDEDELEVNANAEERVAVNANCDEAGVCSVLSFTSVVPGVAERDMADGTEAADNVEATGGDGKGSDEAETMEEGVVSGAGTKNAGDGVVNPKLVTASVSRGGRSSAMGSPAAFGGGEGDAVDVVGGLAAIFPISEPAVGILNAILQEKCLNHLRELSKNSSVCKRTRFTAGSH